MSGKLTVALLYGGRSGEHEVALRSGASVFRHLDRSRFDVLPVAIDKQGRWLLHDAGRIDPAAASLPVSGDTTPVMLPALPGRALVPVGGGGAPVSFDVIFPVMHGPLCEDGTIQGLFELAEVPYVGCGVAASAVGMDKDLSKRLARDAGVPVVPWITLRTGTYRDDPAAGHAAIAADLGFPNFVKPANMGSSVGVTKVKSAGELPEAIAAAFAYDTRVLVEKAVDAREIEVAVLQATDPSREPMTSAPGEIRPNHEFYSYQAKYIDESGAALFIPAQVTDEQATAARHIARRVFTALECEGLARVDLFLDRAGGEVYFNEINTLPGFTSISMYPKLWEASGLAYGQLLTHLVELAIGRHRRRQGLARDYTG